MNRWALIVAVILGGVAAFLAKTYIDQARHDLSVEKQKVRQTLEGLKEQMVRVVVAAEDIPPGAIINKDILGMMEVPEQYVQPFAFTSPRMLIGQVTTSEISKGEQILSNKVEKTGMGITAASRIPPTKRAITLDVDRISAVNGLVRPGDRVDLIWTLPFPGPKGATQPVMITLLQNALVLAMGSELVGGESASGTQAESKSTVMTFALNPQETELLLFAKAQGTITVSLRPVSDTEVLPLNPLTMQDVLRIAFPQLISNVAQAQETQTSDSVEVFRGVEREVVAVQE